ncbi:IPT/TIG domain-containing protein [Kitasatospora sp. NPDC005856]|uniref:IPT/TIG domain-containing protein n=1 Tax=Kitasatospora sp. NPDC005856 TaxID=3154566 RepID=UPI0033DA65C6
MPPLFAPKPRIDQVGATTGPGTGGTPVTVTGESLAGAMVLIGGRPAARHSCGPQLCTATAPAADRPGLVDVTVTAAGGTSGPVTFTYTP